MKKYRRKNAFVQAEPMTRGEYYGSLGIPVSFNTTESQNKPGYKVCDGDITSWMPEKRFNELFSEVIPFSG